MSLHPVRPLAISSFPSLLLRPQRWHRFLLLGLVFSLPMGILIHCHDFNSYFMLLRRRGKRQISYVGGVLDLSLFDSLSKGCWWQVLTPEVFMSVADISWILDLSFQCRAMGVGLECALSISNVSSAHVYLPFYHPHFCFRHSLAPFPIINLEARKLCHFPFLPQQYLPLATSRHVYQKCFSIVSQICLFPSFHFCNCHSLSPVIAAG